MESPAPIRCTPPKNLGLLELIRAKREWDWKPSVEQLRKGFAGWHQRGYLPHFDAPGVTQFITCQIHDSFPATCRAEFEALLKEPDHSVKRRKLEAWLDRGHGECWLRRRDVAELVVEILLEGDGPEYQVQAWVVMPNHIHLVVDVWDVPLVKSINVWKGRSSRDANGMLGRRGAFWQEDYYDTVIRDKAHLKRAIRYTEQNPVKAFLTKAARDWLWSSARRRDEYERLPWQRPHGRAAFMPHQRSRFGSLTKKPEALGCRTVKRRKRRAPAAGRGIYAASTFKVRKSHEKT